MLPAGCLRDLQRFFRYDDPESRPAFFAVSKYNFARSDLVPLIVTYPEDYEVVYNAREQLIVQTCWCHACWGTAAAGSVACASALAGRPGLGQLPGGAPAGLLPAVAGCALLCRPWVPKHVRLTECVLHAPTHPMLALQSRLLPSQPCPSHAHPVNVAVPPLTGTTGLPCPASAVKVATFLTMPSSEPLVTTNKALQEEHMQVRLCSVFCLFAGQESGGGHVTTNWALQEEHMQVGRAGPMPEPRLRRGLDPVTCLPCTPVCHCNSLRGGALDALAPTVVAPFPAPQAVREAFLAQDALAAVVGMLAEPLARHPRMDEKDAALVQLVIAFLK